MGCDIHIFVEKKNGDKWEPVAGPNPWKQWHFEQYQKEQAAGRDGKFHLQRYEHEREKCYENWIYDNRNYTLFSLLADVRNGISSWRNEPATGRYIEPIAQPKGLPEDVSDYVSRESDDDWGCYGHSHSYFTLRELQNYIPNRNVKYSGLVGKSEYIEYRKNGHPNGWSGGSNAKLISNEEMERWILGETEYDGFVQTLIQWEEPINNTGFYGIVHKLEDLGIHPDDVRIVFWFDN